MNAVATVVRPERRRLPDAPTHALGWAAAVALFGAGDLLTTAIGLGMVGVIEQHPAGVALLASAGVGGLVAWKVVVLGLFAIGAAWVPEPYELGIPLGLAVLGGSVTAWNLGVILA